MDPFTQRMLERARARREKIDQKLVNTGQSVPKRKPLIESNLSESPTKSPAKTSRTSISSPKKSVPESPKANSPAKTPNRRPSVEKTNQVSVLSPQKARSDVVVTRKEFKSPKKGSLTRRNSDVSVEINISHRNDIQIEVQVEERDVPISVVYDSQACSGSNVIIKEIEDSNPDQDNMDNDAVDSKPDRAGLRHNIKSRLDRLGNLYSDNPQLSSPIHRTEQAFTSATPPRDPPVAEAPQPAEQGKKKFGRLAALADQINNWEDDLTHHNFNPEPVKKKPFSKPPAASKEESTLDVSIHSLRDINKVLQTNGSDKHSAPKINTQTFKKPMNECQRLDRQIVAELVWSDFKNNTKRKWARINKAAKVKKLKANISTDLTDVEKRVMAIMGESITFMGESVTLDTHNDCMESNQDDDDSDNSSKNSEPNPVTSFKISPTRSSSSASIVEENPEPTSSACYKRPRRTFIRQPPREEKEEDEKSIETEIERDRDRMMYDLELERIRQRDVELKLQGRWLDFMNDCLGLLKGYLEKKNSEESRVTV